MSNQVATKQETSVSVQSPAPAQTVLSGDLLIPKVLLMQGLSEFVADRKATQGDIVRSTTVEILGGPNDPVEFIPLSYTTIWVLQEKVGNKFEFRGVEPVTSANQNLPWDFEQGGTQWKRVKTMNVYALLPADIAREQEAVLKTMETGEMPDASIALMPVVISFRSTSYNAGKKVATHFANVESLKRRYPVQYSGIAPYASTLKLTCRQDKNDLGQYYVLDVETAGKTNLEYQEQAKIWSDTLASSQVRVDDSDLTKGEEVHTNQY